MKTKHNYSNYGNELRLTLKDANLCSHSGPCDDVVERCMELPYIKNQLKQLDPKQLARELKEYGAWGEKELSDHNENLKRWVWISAGDILERD